MGNFAQMSLPLADSVTLNVQRVNSSAVQTFSVRPYFGDRVYTFEPLTLFYPYGIDSLPFQDRVDDRGFQ